MPILREVVSWGRDRGPRSLRASTDFTDAERHNIRTAIRFLRARYGGTRALAAALRAGTRSVDRALGSNPRPSSEIVLRAAKLAHVKPDDLLEGRYPPPNACPTCERVT